jgi:hypothetical protein
LIERMTRAGAALGALLLGACASPNRAPLAWREVEAGCGQCQFALPGPGCDLAVRFDAKAFFVRGTGIDDHGDAHAEDGFCNAVRRARVQGRVEEGVFVAAAFELESDG